MPRFYFNIRDNSSLFVADDKGEVFADLEKAIAGALVSARWILDDDVKVGNIKSERVFEITDENGHILATLPFRDAL